jgi:DHA3 family multidrug efflux protein-like MFS transporter
MGLVLLLAIGFTICALGLLAVLQIPETKHASSASSLSQSIDIKGTMAAILALPGLLSLIFFSTFNNFLAGVFMALMDAYGLSLVSVESWGVIWGFVSFAFIAGGILIAKLGLGKNPLKTLLLVNLGVWLTCILFPIWYSIIPVVLGSIVWMFLFPFMEASEQTVIQKVVPPERMGRVFGFAQSVEQMASPITAFMIGPVAEFLFIPFMTNGLGAELIGSWFGTGYARGIALVFVVFGVIGFVTTLLAFRSRAYALLSKKYLQN